MQGTSRVSMSGMSRASVERRARRPPRMRSRVSENGRERMTASCARRTFAAATSFMADVIFFVFFTEVTRSRSSLTFEPMETAACRDVTAETGEPWKAETVATSPVAKTTTVPRIAR
jgi:hypothetical protein